MKFYLFPAPLLVALCLSPSLASAQVSDFDRTTARALGQEGHEALDKKDWAVAADRFTRADSLVHAPTFLLGLAEAQVGLGKLVSALESYNRIFREGLPANPPPPFVKAFETAQREFELLKPRIPYVILQVASTQEVKVAIDGIEVPKAALGVRRAVDPGKHLIRVEGAGVALLEASLMSVEGKTETLTLEPKPKVPAPPLPSKTAQAGPPPAGAPSQVGHPLAVRSATGSMRRTLGIGGLIAGGAGLGLGAALGGVVIAKHGDIAKSCPDGHCPLARQAELQPTLDSYHLFSNLSTVSFIVGGVLGGAGGVLFFTAPSPQKATVGQAHPWITITPVVGAGFAGAEGSF